jgi:iturin family lipopeptide synthetase A
MDTYTGLEIAVVGLAVRFPEADNVQQFWNNLVNGKNSIGEFNQEELLKAGEDASIIRNPHYVKFGSYLKNKAYFDSGFFNYRPDEAELMDPQIRIFHECCWEALEDSGFTNTTSANQKVGLFATGSPSLNWSVYASLRNAQEQLVDSFSLQQLSDVTFLSSMVSYRLNLRGPVIFLQTACSSSLAAIHQGCNSLLLGECNIALAGGVTINNFSNKGYLYQKGQILSVDGKCCPFDHKASGTVFSEGAGVVVLKRLKDAMKDGDNIHAIIKGSAINNDGNDKVGYTAPSISGQVEVISKAIMNAKVAADSISYIEAHGTGTVLGDPIEMEALNHAFRISGSKKTRYCAIGSVKSNIGHLDAASGVAGFIKVVMALKNKQVPATLHFEEPNPNIHFDDTPFYVNHQLSEWNHSSHPLRAGVSSLGVGGTNVHVIMEEAPVREASSSSRPYQLLTVSARTLGSLERNAENLRNYLKENREVKLPDIAYTLNACRTSFEHRKILVCKNREDAIEMLSSYEEEKKLRTTAGIERKSSLAFMFPGQGAQRTKMCSELFKDEPVFRDEAKKCFEIIKRQSGKDIHSIIFSDTQGKIDDTEFTQPALFVIEYSLARLLMSWGIQPDVMIGHSIGEYVAACLSGVFTLEDALALVVKRGELMQRMAKGVMLSIVISEEELRPYLEKYQEVSLAAVNSSSSCVVSGSESTISNLQNLIETDGFLNKKLRTSHAFHSHMMDEILVDFEEAFKGIKIGHLKIPFISNLTGKKAVDQEISTPKYWVNQLRYTVRFSEGISAIMNKEDVLFVEVGPGQALSSSVRGHHRKGEGHQVINLLGQSKEEINSLCGLLAGVGKLWQYGVDLDWKSYYTYEDRHRVSLPGYSFERTQYPVDVNARAMISEMISDKSLLRKDLPEWFYAPTWKLSSGISNRIVSEESGCTLVFADQCGISESIIEGFRNRYEKVITVKAGTNFEKETPDTYVLHPGDEESYHQLFKSLAVRSLLPTRIVHCWEITEGGEEDQSKSRDLYFYSLVNLVKVSQHYKSGLHELTVLTNGLHNILGQEHNSSITKSLGVALLKVIGQEYPSITTGHIDISLFEETDLAFQSRLFNEIIHPQPGKVVSYRNSCRWVQIYENINIEQSLSLPGFKSEGVYLITGGLGGFGYAMSKYLSKHFKGNLILLGREELPPKEEWSDYVTDEHSNKIIKQKIERIRSIENEGGEVLYCSCDISSREKFSEVVKLAEERFGVLNGVFHAAGVATGRSVNPINQLDRTDFESQFSSKINGLKVLHEVLKDRDLDFCLLISSVSSILGGLGFGAYSPANVFMDYFIQVHKKTGSLRNWVSINLDAINFDDSRSNGINYQELPDLINHVLSLKELPQVVVSTTELQPRLDAWINKKNFFNDYEKEIPLEETISEEGLTPGEKKLMKLWVNFFGRSNFGKDDDFFEIGGDSLKALTLQARINKDFKTNLSLSDFFKKSSIRSLAAYLSKINENGHSNAEHAPIKAASVKDYYDLSPSQRRLHFLNELDKHSTAYNLPHVVKLEGKLDSLRLTSAFEKLVVRHESLRTSFHEIDGKTVQKIENQVAFVVSQIETKEEELDKLIANFIRPFDLTLAPLLRVGLAKLSENEHVLMVDIHHIITDGISQGIMIKDFIALYNNEQLSELPLQYKDYVAWQQEAEQQERLAGQRAFWKQEFSESVSVLDLPTDHSRPLVKSYRGSNSSFLLDKEETKQLRALGEEAGATMFMTLLSIFNVLLNKLSAQEDITIGTAVAGRNHADLEGVLGIFINVLALRNYPKGELTFREFLSQVRTSTLSCFGNQTYPYEELINELQIERDTRRNPLFDVTLAFQNFNQEELIIPGLKLKSNDNIRDVSKFDLELTATESNGELHLYFEYSTDLFEKQTIERFISYFRQIVKVVTTEADKKLSQIDILSKEERHKLLYDFNDTTVDYSRDKTLIDLFEDRVRMHPTKAAINFKGQQFSYKELNEKSNQLARYLLSVGIIPGSVVGLLLDRSLEMIVGMLGVLKAGAGYLPIDPGLPEQRVEYMLDQSRASLLLTHQLYLERHSAYLPVKDINSAELYIGGVENVRAGMEPTDLAYCIFTSGSTGLPKGVMMGHRSVINLVKGLEAKVYRYYGNKTLRVALLASYAFDASVQQIFGALLLGHCLYICDEMDRKDGSRLMEFYNNNGIDLSDGTPTHLRLLVNSQVEESSLKSLNSWILAGELLPKELVKEFYKKNGDRKVKLFNFYGPTETCVDSTSFEIDPAKLDEYPTIPIGKPLPNERVYITDKYGNLVPLGVTGELCIAGDGLGQRYIGDAVLTSEKFPEDWIPGEKRVYRTGDLAKWLPCGNIEYQGRMDNQVKIRGYRIELGEIENQLIAHQEIKDVVVLAKEREEGKYLICYFVSDEEIRSGELQDFLSRQLPDYMIPSQYVRLEGFPLTSNGKLDHKALPDFEFTTGGDYVSPSNEIEEILVEIWSNVLKIDKKTLSVNRNFFEIGGNSLNTVVLKNNILKTLNIQIPIIELFNKPSIQEQAAIIEAMHQMQNYNVDGLELTEISI